MLCPKVDFGCDSGGVQTREYFVYLNASPTAACLSLGSPGNRDPDSVWRHQRLGMLVERGTSHNSWMHANTGLNNGHQQGPSIVQGIWIMRGVAAPMWVGEVVEGVDLTGFRLYAVAEEYVGRDEDMALFAGQLKNHRVSNGLVFIAVHVSWTMLKPKHLPSDSLDLAADFQWALNTPGTNGRPPSSIADKIRKLLKANEDFVLRHLTAPGENTVFGCSFTKKLLDRDHEQPLLEWVGCGIFAPTGAKASRAHAHAGLCDVHQVPFTMEAASLLAKGWECGEYEGVFYCVGE
ncbi:hypothetical protein OF83DRAFT_1177674 [Amylostereum chailletii]|nr:hypothetical protein OF83DRAFT_1177674 [Amylostereum chailletii]